MSHLARLLLLGIALVTATFATETEPSAPEKNIDALRSILPLIQREERNLAEIRKQLEATSSEVNREQLAAEMATIRDRLAELKNNFQSLSSGVDEATYFDQTQPSPTLNSEIQEILKPLLDELRSATSAPREMEELRDNLEQARQRRRIAASAVERLSHLREDPAIGPELQAEVGRVLEKWQERRDETDGRIAVLEAQLAERERDAPTVLESISGGLVSFWRSRGLNLLLGLASLVVTVLLLRRLYRVARRISPFHRKGEPRLTSRLVDLLAGGLGILLGITSMLVVFYLRGDWLLLTLAAILLAGVAIASRESLPPYLDQIRTILNLGPVREGERLLFDGVPWRVDRLGFYCHFSNPRLGGGSLRLPIRRVNELYSRPCDKREPWFPTRENDWVVLGDETLGKVVQQTPERVTVLRLGGSRRTYPTAEFLSLSPENLSTGFRVSSIFGIDYAHQAISTTEVPETFTRRLEAALQTRFGDDCLHHLQVEFHAAGASSLDFEVLADFTGEAAPRYRAIRRLLQKLCVDVCNDEGWVIPFTQVTVHTADPGVSLDAPGSQT